MPRPNDPRFVAALVRAIEQAEHDSQGRVGASTPNITLFWGYVWPDGTHDMGACSPPSNLTAQQQAQIIETSYNNVLAAGGSPARWVDGYPSNVVSAVASYLNVPIGQPPDWFDTTG